jgi:hypothetical protein
MKKMILAVMAVAAIGFTSCTNKQQAPADQVETAIDGIDVEGAISEATAQLTEQIEAQDATKFQEVLASIQAKVKDFIAQNPDVAKQYLAKIQDFLKDNAEKIKAFTGDNQAVQAALGALTVTPAESLVDGLLQAVDEAGQAGEEAIDAAKEATEDAIDAAKEAAEDKANELKEDAKEAAGEAVDAAADKTKKALGL